MLRIVLVDDDRVFIEGVKQHVKWDSFGLIVGGVAYNGLDAIELCKKTQPDLLLSDVRMPGLDGIGSAVRIHEEAADCHIIFISAYAQPQDYRKAIRLGALDFLEKPLDMEELNNALRHAVAQRTTPVKPWLNKHPSGIIRDVMHIIDGRYMENLTVEYLAQTVFFTPNYLSSLFHRETGMTISQYLTQCRMEASILLLRHTNKTIATISEEVGYHDARHFSKTFQKYYNMKPSSMRRN